MEDDNFAKVFSKNLRTYLANRGMNQKDLYDALNRMGVKVGTSSISFWCSGKKIPRMDKVDAICKVLNVKRSDLIADDKELIIEVYPENRLDSSLIRIEAYTKIMNEKGIELLLSRAEELIKLGYTKSGESEVSKNSFSQSKENVV